MFTSRSIAQVCSVVSTPAPQPNLLCSTHSDLLRLDLGRLQGGNEVKVIHGAALGGAQAEQDAVLNFLQFLLHLGVGHDQLVLGFLQIWSLLGHDDTQELVLQTTVGAGGGWLPQHSCLPQKFCFTKSYVILQKSFLTKKSYLPKRLFLQVEI